MLDAIFSVFLNANFYVLLITDYIIADADIKVPIFIHQDVLQQVVTGVVVGEGTAGADLAVSALDEAELVVQFHPVKDSMVHR